MSRKTREFFYRDKDGKVQDKACMSRSSGIDPEAVARVRNISKEQARKAGISEDMIMKLYPDD